MVIQIKDEQLKENQYVLRQSRTLLLELDEVCVGSWSLGQLFLG